jgi:hypothetical protein
MISNLIFINGIYDIICGISILFFPKFFFAKIHPQVFHKKYIDNDILKRFIAYWIITQGFIRLYIHQIIINNLIAISYLIEAFVFAYEYIYFKTMIFYKTLWIVITSLILCFLSLNVKEI